MRLFFALEPPFRWAQVDRRGAVTDQGIADALEQLITLAQSREAIGVVAGSTVVIRSAQIPTRRRAKVETAAPYVLEESLSAEIDSLHFALLDWEPGGDALIAVVSREHLRQWSKTCADAGIRLDAVVPDFLLVPRHAQAAISIAVTDDANVCIRDGAYTGMTIERQYAQAWWDELQDKHTAVAVNDTNLAAQFIQSDGSMVSEWSMGRNFADWLAVQAPTQPLGNLLTGDFMPAHRKQGTRGIKAAIAVATAALVIKVVIDASEYFYLTKKSARLDAQIEQVFRWTFPEVKRIVNPKAQMQTLIDQALSGYRGGGEFTRLLNAVAHAVPAARSRVEEIVYRDNALTVTCTAQDFAALDLLKGELEKQPDIRVELLSSGAQDKQVRGRFRLTQGQS